MGATPARAVPIGALSQIPVGEGRNMVVGERTMAVFHLRSGVVVATQPTCPHKGGPLADGLTGEHTVMCPLHDRLFDLRTGAGPDCAIAVAPVEIRDGTMHVWLDEADQAVSATAPAS